MRSVADSGAYSQLSSALMYLKDVTLNIPDVLPRFGCPTHRRHRPGGCVGGRATNPPRADREAPRMPRITRLPVPPPKDCACCGRPFTWRKKWERDWPNVKYCSDACRRKGSLTSSRTAP
jgi:hypothetical protein